MAEYLAPGVFLEEKDLKAPAIESVSTSTTGMVGHARRGPTLGPPVLVTNMLQFRQHFGGPLPTSAGTVGEMFYAAQGFFANGGRRLYVIRTAAAAAARTQFATQGGIIARLAAGSDAAVGAPNARLASTFGLRDGSSLTFSFVRDGVTYVSSARTIAVNGIISATGDITLTANLDVTPVGPAAYPASATAAVSGIGVLNAAGSPVAGARAASVTFQAADPGAWGDGIVITSRRVEAGRSVALELIGPGAANNNRVRVQSAAAFYPLAWVQIDRGSSTDKIIRQVLAVNVAELREDLLLALVVMGEIGAAGRELVDEHGGRRTGKRATARFFATRMLPTVHSLLENARGSADELMQTPVAAFAA